MSESKSLNKSIAGRAVQIGTAVTPVHELDKDSSVDTIHFSVFNSADSAKEVELHWNGVITVVTVPANDSKPLGPLTFEGRAQDNTPVANKNISFKAPAANEISVMGTVD